MAARPVFLDTNGWFAVLNQRDVLHAEANARWHDLLRQGCIFAPTDWVIAETGNGLARTPARLQFTPAVRQMRRSARFRVISVDPILMERALDLYADRPDQTWGLVDCASFVAMKDEGITDAFTTDRHFEQAGFNCLLPASVA